MTDLVGTFEYELEPELVSQACARAIGELGWAVDSARPDHFVVHPRNGFGEYPPTIEVLIYESDFGSEVDILGKRPDSDQLDDKQLIPELDRMRQALEAQLAGPPGKASGVSLAATAAGNGRGEVSRELLEDVPTTDVAIRREERSMEATAAPRVNRLARGSFLLSVLWLGGVGSMLAILAGGAALRQIDRSAGEQGGRTLAMTGIFLGALGAVLTIGVAIAVFGS